MSDYNASKSGLNTLHETLRYELDKVYVVWLHLRCLLTTELPRYKTPAIRTTLVLPGRVLTPLFKYTRMSPSPFRKFFMPDVPPVAVVKKIIAALDDQHSQKIILPFYGHFMPLLQQLPSFLRDFASWVSSPSRFRVLLPHVLQITSADESMNDFQKVSGLRENEKKA